MKFLIVGTVLLLATGMPAVAEEGNNMSETAIKKPAERPWAGAFILVRDIETALIFYSEVFGLERGQSLADDAGRVFHAEMEHQGTAFLMMSPADNAAPDSGYGPPPASGGPAPSFNFYLYLADVDGPAARAAEAGGDVIQEPRDEFWGDRTAMIRDPDGYLWMIAKHLGGAAAPE